MPDLDDYAPYDDGLGANRTEEWFRQHFAPITGSGVIAGIDGDFAVTQHAGGDQSVDVAAGQCFIRGQWGKSTSTKTVGLSAAHATLARIDRIVLRNDFSANKISIEVLEGTPGATPAIPALTQSSSRWEIGLARIARAATDNVVGTADITDERNFLTFTGNEGGGLLRPVRVATTAAITLATGAEAGDTIDGVTLAAGDSLLVKDQASGAENGPYIVNQTGAPTRRSDFDASSKVRAGVGVRVAEGTTNADKTFFLTTNAPIVLGTTALTFAADTSTGAGATVVRKTATESVTSSTTMQDDDHLSFVCPANKTHVGEIVLFVETGAEAADLLVEMTTSTGTLIVGVHGLASTTTAETGDMNALAGGSGTDILIGIDAGFATTAVLKFIVTAGGTDATVKFRWAQGVSSATATSVLAGSHLTHQEA
jgi:hypothetical protein